MSLLRKVKLKSKEMPIRQAPTSSLTKTIVIIIAAILVISDVPLIRIFAILTLNKEKQLIKMKRGVFAWILTPQ